MSEIKVKLLSHWGPGDKRVCESAWTSTYDRDKFETKTEEQIDKVINIVVGQGHGTPLESTWLEFYLEIPIYIERQLDKYRMTQQYQDIQVDKIHLDPKPYDGPICGCAGISQPGCFCGTDEYKENLKKVAELNNQPNAIEVEYQFAPMGRDNITQNELSGRYRTIPNRFLEMPEDVSGILSKVGQYLDDRYTAPDMGTGYIGNPSKEWKDLLEKQYWYYNSVVNIEMKDALKENVITQAEYKRAREFYRGILGTAFITHMKLVLNLRAFENILRERLAPDAQPEIQEVARLMLSEVINANVAPKVLEKMIERNLWIL